MSVRRHLRFWAALSLVLQSAWLLAIVPADCCAAHAAAHATPPPCHEEEVEASPYCPMKGTTGEACPMHQAAAAVEDAHAGMHHGDTHGAPAVPDTSCQMSAGCDGPMSALISLLAIRGLVPDPQDLLPFVDGGTPIAHLREQLTSRFVPPEPPPPRA